MEGRTGSEQQYVLGNQAEELERLDHQASVIERPTRLLLQAAGVAPGMRVLDLGTGLGHVARLAGELVGPSGSVLGIDRSSEALTAARQRSQHAGTTHVTFVDGDVSIPRRSPYSALSASSGLSRAARRAGSQHASRATPSKTRVVTANTPGSRGLTP